MTDIDQAVAGEAAEGGRPLGAGDIGAILSEVLRLFTEKGHPGYEAVRTCWVPVERLTRWSSALAAATEATFRAPEPSQVAVARVETDRSKYPEIWVASNINIGRWYPDSESWIAGSARHDHPEGCDWSELCRRGTVTLLTAGDPETYAQGWEAGAMAAAHAAEEIAYQAPEYPGAEDDFAEDRSE